MKKTLIAVAALAATSAFAQVTVSGLLDLSYHQVGGSGTNATTKLSSVGASVGSATSAINLAATEDLGRGMSAVAFYAFDPRAITNNSGNAIGRHEVYVGLNGAFGGIKLGSPNTAALQVHGTSSFLGTATGSAFANIETAAGGAVRFNNSLRYDTPNLSGFSASLTYAPGNKDATNGTAAAGTIAAPSVTDLGLAYVNGPLTVRFSSLSRSDVDGQAAIAPVAGNAGTAAVNASVKTTYNNLGASYALTKQLTLSAGAGKGSDIGGTGVDTTMTRVGARFVTGPVTLIGQYATLEIGTANDRKALGLRAEYALGKRTATYVAYESYDSGAATANKTNTTAAGLRVSF